MLLDGFAQGVLVADVRAVHAVQHHVHAGDTEHGGVEVEAPEHLAVDVLAVGIEQVAVFVGEGTFRAGMHAVEVFHGASKKACGAAGRVAEHLGGLWGDQLDHRVNDMARRAKWPLMPAVVSLLSRYS